MYCKHGKCTTNIGKVYCVDPDRINGMERVLYLCVNRFLFYNNILEIVSHEEEKNYPRHDFKSFSVWDASLKLFTTMLCEAIQNAAHAHDG